MATLLSLVLGGGLAGIPFVLVQLPDVQVQGLRQHRAGGDRPVRPINISWFSMPFVKKKCIACVELLNTSRIELNLNYNLSSHSIRPNHQLVFSFRSQT